MEKVFLDTNYFIALANRSYDVEAADIGNTRSFVSTLSCHILFYINKIKTPDKETSSFIDDFNLVDFDSKILNIALQGPTSDLEDNIQLHSAAEKQCDHFLTFDRKLLKMKFFGKMKISKSL